MAVAFLLCDERKEEPAACKHARLPACALRVALAAKATEATTNSHPGFGSSSADGDSAAGATNDRCLLGWPRRIGWLGSHNSRTQISSRYSAYEEVLPCSGHYSSLACLSSCSIGCRDLGGVGKTGDGSQNKTEHSSVRGLAFSSISIRVSYIDNLPLQQHFHFVGDVGIKATNY